MKSDKGIGLWKRWGWGKKSRKSAPTKGFDYLGASAVSAATEPGYLPEQEGFSRGFPLSEGQPGMELSVVGFQGEGSIKRLLAMGIVPGSQLQILSRQPSGSVVVAIADNRLGLGATLAARVIVSTTPLPETLTLPTSKTSLHLGEMSLGTRGRIVGYEPTHRAYKSKLLSMGLTPGTEFEMIRVAPLGDPVEIRVRGFHLSLRKQEADALQVEILRVGS